MNARKSTGGRRWYVSQSRKPRTDTVQYNVIDLAHGIQEEAGHDTFSRRRCRHHGRALVATIHAHGTQGGDWRLIHTLQIACLQRKVGFNSRKLFCSGLSHTWDAFRGSANTTLLPVIESCRVEPAS